MAICLSMIVKNEAHVIKRCLDSVRPYIDSWVIVDTGSTDGTQDAVKELLRDLPGVLVERPWRDFATNRNEALALARERGEYVLFLDADEEVISPPGYRLHRLTKGAYMVLHQSGTSTARHHLTQLVRSDLPFRYTGVLHEVIVCDAPFDSQNLEGLLILGHFDSARNKDPVTKYRHDAEVFEEALLREPGNARYVYYLAQSYRDAGDLREAIDRYERRAKMGGWEEEIFSALYQVGLLHERLGSPTGIVADALLRAHNARPSRAEALHDLARVYRLQGQFQVAALFAREALKLRKPDDLLFVDHSVYEWRVKDELSIALYWIGRYKEGLELVQQLLANPKLPAGERERVEKNGAFCRQKLGR